MSRPFSQGPILSGWTSTKLRTVMTRKKRLGRPDLPLLSVNLPVGVLIRPTDSGRQAPSEDLSGYQVVNEGDLVVNQLGKPHGALGVSKHSGIISPAYFVAEFNEKVEPNFMHHLLRTRLYISEYERRGKFMPPNQFDISWDEFRDIEVVLPPRSQQKAIADYLDCETMRIDSLIEKKRRMVDLVDEKIVSTCETLLNSDGSAPVRLKHFVMKVGSGSTPRGGSDVYVDSGVAFLRSQNIKDGQINHDDVVYITDKDDEILRRTRIQAGDVLLNITGGSIGRTAIAKSHDLPANVSQHVCVIRPNTSVSSDLLQAALDSSNVQEQIDLMQVGGNREGLNFEQIRNLMIVIPNPQNALRIEQNLIVERLRLKKVKELLLMQIDLLVIRRQALTIAAVTGELEIPEVAA